METIRKNMFSSFSLTLAKRASVVYISGEKTKLAKAITTTKTTF